MTTKGEHSKRQLRCLFTVEVWPSLINLFETKFFVLTSPRHSKKPFIPLSYRQTICNLYCKHTRRDCSFASVYLEAQADECLPAQRSQSKTVISLFSRWDTGVDLAVFSATRRLHQNLTGETVNIDHITTRTIWKLRRRQRRHIMTLIRCICWHAQMYLSERRSNAIHAGISAADNDDILASGIQGRQFIVSYGNNEE